MAATTITPPIYVGPPFIRDNTASTATLDATSESVSWVLQAPKTGTIDRIHFYATTVTADGDGLRVRIETVNGSDGNPSGTLVGGSSEVTVVTTTANSWNRSGAGLAAAVTQGDIIAVKLSSPTAGTTFNGIIRYSFQNAYGPGVATPTTGLFPYVVTFLGGVTTKAVIGLMDMAIEYNDGTTPYILSAAPLSTVTSTAFNNASTPDERGNLFQVPAPMRAIGFYHGTLPSGVSQTFDLVLYDSGSSALETISVDLDQDRTGVVGSRIHILDTKISLTANTDYRLVIKPTVASNMTTQHMVCDTATGGTRLREAFMSGTTWKLTTRTDAGAWTNTDDSVACVGLIVDQIDDGASAGGSSTPYIIGG